MLCQQTGSSVIVISIFCNAGIVAVQDKVNSITNDVATCSGKPRSEPKAKERRAPLCTNYRLRVCLCTTLTDSFSGCFREWLMHAQRVYDIQIHACIYAHRHGQRGVLNRHRCNQTNAFLWAGSCWCVTAVEKFVYGIQGHAGWFSWSMFVYRSQRICLHMFHILGVFSFMRQQQPYT